MRVAQLTCVYPPYGGGIGEVAYRYATALALEHQVTVFTPRYGGRRNFKNTAGVKVEALKPLLAYGNAAFLPQLWWRLKKFDVVHLHYPFFGAHEFLPQLNKNQKLIVTYHMVPRAGGLRGFIFRLEGRLMEQRLAKRADSLLALTQDYITTIALPRLGHSEKWQVLPAGVDNNYLPGEVSARLKHQLGIKEHMPVVLFVGSLDSAHEFKGVDVLLRAMEQLKHRTWRLLIVGKGNLRSRYEKFARDLGIQRQVEFCGYVPDAELPNYFRLASVFVLPSINEAEAFGLVLLQAMACGVPVVASGLPGVRELVGVPKAGLLVTPGDALALSVSIDHILDSKLEAQEMGERGREIVEQKYRWDRIGESLRELYKQLP
jgi:glycosyltransferase involved in cell wall biosynthesis